MEQIKEISLRGALNEGMGNIVCYVLPQVREHVDPDKPSGHDPQPYLLTCFLGEDLYLIESGTEELGNFHYLRAGMRIEVSWDFLNSKISSEIYYKSPIAPFRNILGGVVNKVKLCKGQAILVHAAPMSGKTYMSRKIIESFKERDPNVKDYKILFGERKVDTMGPGTIHCDPSATIEYQLYILNKYISCALRDAYSGKDVILAIDSLTRIMDFLSNRYAHSHMVSGGIAASVNKMVMDLFSISGQLGEGTLTLIGTCLWARSNNTWKTIYWTLSAIATAEFNPEVRSGKQDGSRIEPDDRSDSINLFGLVELKI